MTVCSVCNRNQTQRVCQSGLMPSSNAYCDPCFEMGLEPWSDFLASLFCLTGYTQNEIKSFFSEKFLTNMLETNNKTINDALNEAKENGKTK